MLNNRARGRRRGGGWVGGRCVEIREKMRGCTEQAYQRQHAAEECGCTVVRGV